MAFYLEVDVNRWRDHQRAVVDAVSRASGSAPVPVIKGDGYGLGASVLSTEAMRLGADTIAVGTAFEVDDVAVRTQGDIIVLEPFTPADPVAAAQWWQLGERIYAGRVIRTISSLEALRALASGPGTSRVILEAHTSMHRFGFSESELLEALNDPDVREAMERGRVLVEGLAVHMPIRNPPTMSPHPACGTAAPRHARLCGGPVCGKRRPLSGPVTTHRSTPFGFPTSTTTSWPWLGRVWVRRCYACASERGCGSVTVLRFGRSERCSRYTRSSVVRTWVTASAVGPRAEPSSSFPVERRTASGFPDHHRPRPYVSASPPQESVRSTPLGAHFHPSPGRASSGGSPSPHTSTCR